MVALGVWMDGYAMDMDMDSCLLLPMPVHNAHMV